MLSYNSIGCAGNFFSRIFPDSKIDEKYSCERTKPRAIVTIVLAPITKKKKIERFGKQSSVFNSNRCIKQKEYQNLFFNRSIF